MVLVKATEDSEAGLMPSRELLEAMGRYNEELVNAGVLLSGEGLHPSSRGVRVAFDGPERTVVNGPFAATGELVAGFWLWEVRDMDEAIEWVKRCPNPMPGPSEIEIRPVLRGRGLRRGADPGAGRAGGADARAAGGGVRAGLRKYAPFQTGDQECLNWANGT